MKFILAITVILWTQAICNNEIPPFEDFLILFNKQYSTKNEQTFRQKIYKSNVEALRNKKQQSNTPYSFKLTKYLDWTPEQLKRLYSKVPQIINVSPDKDLRVSSRPIKVRGLLPQSLNWNNLGKVTAPKDQGDCGSCFSFSAAGLIESHFLINKGVTTDLSEQYLLECNPDGMSCGGGDPVHMLEFALNSGLPNESNYQYDPNNGHFGICETQNKTYLPDNTGIVMTQMGTPDDMMTMLQNGPVLSLFSIYDIDSFKAYSSGSYTGCPLNDQLPISMLNHAVVVVGYDANDYIVKNSWGQKWGDGGFFRVPKNQSCGIGIFNVQLSTCAAGAYYNQPTTPNIYGYLNDVGTLNCLPCDTSCATCKNNQTCTSCPSWQQLYILSGACVSQCPNVTSPYLGQCVCSGGSYYTNSKCLDCNPLCASCDNSSVCKTCKPGLFKNLLNGECVAYCPINTQPINNNSCTCPNTTYRRNNTCRNCIIGCRYCTNNNSCQQCIYGVLSYDKTSCLMCPPNCRVCISGTCSQCQLGYLLDAYTLRCSINCSQPWMVVVDSICQCKGQYDSSTGCKFPCPLICNSSCFSQNVCTQCIGGYFLDTQTGSCKNCSDQCMACSNISTNCTQCQLGTFLVNNTCLKCSQNCYNCTSANFCNICLVGFQKVNQLCVCPNNTYLYKGSCQYSCPDGMIGMNGQCTCPSSSLLSVNGDCLVCPPLCLQCTNSTCYSCKPNSILLNGSCQCANGFYPAGNDCFACLSPCQTCIALNICLSCQPNFKKNETSCCSIGTFFNSTNKTCDKCPANCSDCQETGCTVCRPNFVKSQTSCICNNTFYYSLQSLDCIQCPAPCFTCSSTTACRSCLNPFILNGTSCKCPVGMYQSNASCLDCSISCKVCASQYMCSDCSDGYYLSGAACLSCTMGCFKCPGGICTNCSTPYILVNGSCVRASCPANCRNCTQNDLGFTCWSCNDFFMLTSSKLCEPVSTVDWQVINLSSNSSIPLNYSVNSTLPCTQIIPLNLTFNFGFIILGNTQVVIVSTISEVYAGNIVLTIAPPNLSFGTVGISKTAQLGIQPNRYASINFSTIDCTNTQKEVWALTFYQNGTSTALLETGPLIRASSNLTIRTPNIIRSSNPTFPLSSGTSKGIVGGYYCSLGNCSMCWPNSNSCTLCQNGLLLQNGSCQSSCNSGYAPYNNYICLPSNSTNGSNNTSYLNNTNNNNANNNTDNKDGGSSTGLAVGLGVGLGVGIPALLGVIIALWCWKNKSTASQAGIIGSQVTMIPDTHRVIYEQQPVMAVPSSNSLPYSMNLLPPPMLEPYQYPTTPPVYPVPYTQQQEYFVMPPMPSGQTISPLPHALPAIPPAPPHYGYREPVMYDPNNRSLQASRAVTVYKG